MPPKNFEEYTVVCGIGNEEKITYVATSDSLTADPSMEGWNLTVSDGDWMTIPISELNTNCTITSLYEPRPLRMTCEYCGCVSKKDYGTCEHCGAPLVLLEYIY